MKISKEKAACLDGTNEAALGTTRKLNDNTKKAKILNKFVELGTQGINCFEAANRYHDYVLRSTVSGLQRDYGIQFMREWIKVPNSFGSHTDCMRYWLDEVNKAKARRLLKNEEVH
jgi:hypothetical protein